MPACFPSQLFLIAGPCQVEGDDLMFRVADNTKMCALNFVVIGALIVGFLLFLSVVFGCAFYCFRSGGSAGCCTG